MISGGESDPDEMAIFLKIFDSSCKNFLSNFFVFSGLVTLEDFLNTEVGCCAMKHFLISEFSPESILFFTEWYFLKIEF